MAVEGLDLEALLSPISEASPTGIDVRMDFSPTSNYFRLRDARAEARAAERAADANPGAEGGLAEGWRTVRSLAVKVLSEQAKDLEVAAWLTESLVRSHGLQGLGFGADVIGGLVEKFWDQLYPMPDEDGMETRVAPVTGLNGEGGDGTLSQPLLKLPLFNDANGVPVLLFQYNQSAELETISDAKRLESRLKAGVVPYDQMQAAARAAPPGVFVALRKSLREAQASWEKMAAAFDLAAGRDSPPTRRISETLDLIATITARYGPPEQTAVDGAAETAAQVDGDAPAAETSMAGVTKPKGLATREDALASLTQIADFFRRTEPQSPLAYTIDDAIRRGRLTWPELIRELVQDDHVRMNILTSLGIKPQ
jgi:type VI secretion system protein ImpA